MVVVMVVVVLVVVLVVVVLAVVHGRPQSELCRMTPASR